MDRDGSGELKGQTSINELLDEPAEVDGLEMGAGKLGIGPRRLADVADQPIHARDVVADDRSQSCAKLRIVDALEPVDRRAK